jgi:hypothetical protein
MHTLAAVCTLGSRRRDVPSTRLHAGLPRLLFLCEAVERGAIT